METEKIVVVNIQWDVIEFDGCDFTEIKKLNSIHDYGLYQVYGHHPAYGDDALLYIGMAPDRTFSERLNNRWEFLESTARPTNICFGRIVQSKDEPLNWTNDVWREMICTCEKLLLKTHSPAFNSQSIKGLEIETENELLIINWGDYKRLLPEISTLRMSYRFWSFEESLSTENINK